MARTFGLDLLWEVPNRAGMCSYEAMRLGVPAFGTEIGGNGRCEREHVALAKVGVRNVLTHLGLTDGAVEPTPRPRVGRGDFTVCPAGGLFEPTVALNEAVRAGQVLYRVLSLRGEVRYEHRAAHAGLVSAIRIFGMIGEGEWDIAVLERVE